MIQNVLQHLGGIERYGILSLCLFFLLFILLMVWAFSLRKPHLERMARLPLNEDSKPCDLEH
jgi:cbb3-type cytochrome oxidase subunit 3